MRVAVFLLELMIASSELVYLVEVCRHGARAPSNMQTWDEGRWPYGDSILTSPGMRQHYLIGTFMRQRYVIDNNFLPEFYKPSDILLVASTKERAQRSLQSQLLGLYPNWDFKPVTNLSIPITTTIKASDLSQYVPSFNIQINQIDPMIHSDDTCPDFKKFQKRRKKTKGMKKIFEKYDDLTKIVQDRYNITDDHDAQDLVLDIIGSIRSNMFEGYDWDPAFDDDFVKRAQELYMETKMYVGYTPDYSARYAGSDFFNNILKQFSEVKAGEMKRKASIYSAHDTTLYSIFATMGMIPKEQPPFASVLLFEVYKESDGFYIKVIFNLKPIAVPGCTGEKCALDTFVKYLDGRVFKDTAEACKQFNNMEAEDAGVIETEPVEFSSINIAVVAAEIVAIGVIFYYKIKGMF